MSETFPDGRRWILTQVEDVAGYGRRLHYLTIDGRRAAFHVFERNHTPELELELGEAFAAGKRIGRAGQRIGHG